VLTLKMVSDGIDDPLGRKPGEILWPERFTEMWVKDQQRDPYKWQTLYQQQPPSDAGQWCEPGWVQLVDEAPPNLNIYLVTDLALSIGRGDYSVHLVVGIDHAGRIYVLDAWRERCSGDETAEKHLELCQHWQPMECLIEDDNASKMYVITLADRARQRRIHVPWKAMSIAGKDKQTRAEPLRSLLKQRRVFFKRSAWNHWLNYQLLQFPVATGEGVDDGVDALGLIGRRLLQLGKPSSPLSAAPPPKPYSFNDLLDDNERPGGAFSKKRI